MLARSPARFIQGERSQFITVCGLLEIIELIRNRDNGSFKVCSKLDLTSQSRAGEGERLEVEEATVGLEASAVRTRRTEILRTGKFARMPPRGARETEGGWVRHSRTGTAHVSVRPAARSSMSSSSSSGGGSLA